MGSHPPEADCYHCGLPVPEATDFFVSVDGKARRMCCAGCQSVAEAIVANGLTDYYRHRDALPQSPREALPAALQEAGLFDLPELRKGFVRSVGEHEQEAALMLEGIACAACVWLNETHLARQPGVTAVDINYATHRARVRWDERRIKLSQILAAIAAIGYRAHPYDPSLSEQLAQKERRAALWRLFVAGFGAMQVMMYAIPAYLAGDGDMSAGISQLMRWASLLLTLPVVLYSSAPFFRSAWNDLRLRRAGMDVPVALGIGSAFVASCWATLTAQGAVYFDSVAMFVFFLLGGRYFEMMARQKAARGVEELARALPAFATRLANHPSLDGERVAVAQLVPGDIVLVKPGEVIPADGEVIDGESAVDESLLTGESLPADRGRGDALTGGSVNVASPLVMRVDKIGEATRLAAILRLVEGAAAGKPRLVVLADRIAARFVTALIVLALATALVWQTIDPARALGVFVAVLVVSCPCALSLATPAALAVANGAFARLGALVTRGHAIETLARATHVVFDKTGTLTEGRLRLADVLPLRELSADEAVRIAAALEQGSEHPVGRALVQAAAALSGPAPAVPENLRSVAGQGIEARLEGMLFRIGAMEYVFGIHGAALPESAQQWISSGGGSVVALADAGGWLALLRFEDRLRRGARETCDGLRALGVTLCILSGDTPAAVSGVAAALGIADAHGGRTPEAKHTFLKALQDGGAIVAMVGDGVNDAPVLAQAQVSIAMGSGADLARRQADIVLLADRLEPLVASLCLARRTLRIVRQNLAWAFAYNLLAIPLAMLGYVAPWMAGIGMSASSLLVVLNALRLQRADRTSLSALSAPSALSGNP